MNPKIPAPQLTAWLIVALSGPLLCVIGQSSWLTTLYASAICGILIWFVFHYGKDKLPPWLSLLEMIWLSVVMGTLARQCDTCWEEASETPIIAATLLLLSMFAAIKGSKQSTRIGATLLWLVLPILAIVFFAGITEVRPQWVENRIEEPNGLLVSLFLAPSLLIYFPKRENDRKSLSGLLIALVITGTAWAIEATLGTATARQSNNAFYDFSKGVNLFGVAERFEALVACALTAGWFALFVLHFSTIYHWGECVFTQHSKWCVILSGGISLATLYILHIPQNLLTVGCLIFWVFLPIAAQGIGGIKKLQKKQK